MLRKYPLPQRLYNTQKLHNELSAALGAHFKGLSGHEADPTAYDADLAADAPPGVEAQIDAIAASHTTTLTAEQDAESRMVAAFASAKTNAAAVPSWATWSQADFQTWYNANISPTQINAITSLAEAKPILLKQSAAIEALGKMVIAMRNQLWPDLQA